MSKPVKVRNAPGLVWRQRNQKWEARWQARTDLIKRGLHIKSVKLWIGLEEPTKEEWDVIADRCNELQQEMIVWARGGVPIGGIYDGTLDALMRAYKSDPDSQYRKIRYNSRVHYNALMDLISREHGTRVIADLKARSFLRIHEDWIADGKVAIAHSKIGMLRTLLSFGATMLEDADCAKLSGILSKMRFPMPKPRTERLTSDQAIAIRRQAHKLGRPSIALAQAFQFELMLRQKDVIGEWVPLAEKGISDIKSDGLKWLRGIRWEEIDENLVLRHVTSKRQKEIEVSLKNAPMVMEELATIGGPKASGPVIVSEFDKLPWTGPEFRRWWRLVANDLGIPKTVRNMDSRAGAISEATDAGADLEHVRHAATHSDIAMTQRYSRGSVDKVENVQLRRIEHRNKGATK